MIPPPKDHERDFIIEDFRALQDGKSVGDKVYSDIYSIGAHMKVRLMLFPRGTDAKQNCLAVFIEVMPPSAAEGVELMDSVNEDKLWAWRYPDVSYFISCIDWRDYTKSKVNTDRFGFSETETDRGWHNFLQLDKLSSYLGPGNQMIFRFGVLPHGLHYATTETRSHHRGLKNHGTTCYLNSSLQCLYHVGDFCSSIYAMTAEEDKALLREKRLLGKQPIEESTDDNRELKKRRADDSTSETKPTDLLLDISEDDDDETLEGRSWTDEEVALALEDSTTTQMMIGGVCVDLSDSQNSIVRALQRVFYNLSRGCDLSVNEPVQCRELIRAFGWNTADQFTQHDAQELNRLLCDRLEDRMKNTPSDGVIRRLFAGESEVYIECTEVDYKSKRVEVFYDLQLDVKNLPNLEASLDEYVREELLDGDNKYNAEGFGAQPAKKGIRFLKFPPVLQFHLKRFQFDLTTMDMVKVNDEFHFPETICFDKWCPNSGTYRLSAVNVHSGDVHEGHYYAFVRVPRPNFDPNLPGDVMDQCSWLKFDDEFVWRCTEDAAIEENFGGAPQEASFEGDCGRPPLKRNYSAYILFYIKESQARELLTPPNPRLVNPGMVFMIALQERYSRRYHRIKRDIETHIKIHLTTESDLFGCPTGVWKAPLEMPSRKSLKFQRDMTAFALWQRLYDLILQGELGVDLQKLYGGDRSLIPGLFYFDYYEASQHINKRLPTPTIKSLASQSGWTERTCKDEELGWGVRLWNLLYEESTRAYHPAGEVIQVTLRTNATYLQTEASQGKRPSMTLLIHPIRVSAHTTMTSTELQSLHENRSLVPLKVFDSFAETAADQNTYFFGILDLPNEDRIRNPAPLNLADLVTSRIVETWTTLGPQVRKHLPSTSRLAVHLDHMTSKWSLDDRPVLDERDLGLYYEHRGCFEAVPSVQSFRSLHNFRVLTVCFPAASSDDLTARSEQARSQLEAIDTTLRNTVAPSTSHVDEVTYFDGSPSPFPSINANLPPTLPPQPPASTPPLWLAALRSVRRIRVYLCDISQFYGRFETLDGKVREEGPLKRSDTTGSLDVEFDATPKNLESQKSTSDGGGSGLVFGALSDEEGGLPIYCQIETEVDISWQTSFVLKWICLVLLKVNPEYVWLFRGQPRNSLHVQERVILSPDSIDSVEEPIDLETIFTRRGPFADLFRIFANAQLRFGISSKLARQCANARCKDAPSIWLGLVPRKTSLYTRQPNERVVFIRLFDPIMGTMGAVCVTSVQISDTIASLITTAKSLVCVDRMQARLLPILTAREWLQQELQLVEHNSLAMKRANPSHLLKSLTSMADSTILAEIPLRLEPAVKWFGPQPSIKTMTAVNVVLIDEASGCPFGYPFSFVVAAGEPFKTTRQRLTASLLHSVATLSSAKIYQTDDLKDEGRKVVMKDQDVLFEDVVPPQMTILIQLSDPSRNARRPTPLPPRRLYPSLHIRG